MNELNREGRVHLSVEISVSSHTAEMLAEMSMEMGTSIDELISALAEDSVIGLAKQQYDFFEDVYIPDSCSTNDLINSL